MNYQQHFFFYSDFNFLLFKSKLLDFTGYFILSIFNDINYIKGYSMFIPCLAEEEKYTMP